MTEKPSWIAKAEEVALRALVEPIYGYDDTQPEFKAAVEDARKDLQAALMAFFKEVPQYEVRELEDVSDAMFEDAQTLEKLKDAYD